MEEIFIISLAGAQYGIRKGDVVSVRSLDALHRIPLSPAGIAGIMLDGDRTVTLFSLEACLCPGTVPEIEQGCILLTRDDDRVGFVVNGQLGTQSVSPQMLFQLPDYLNTPAFDGCAVYDDIPVPLISIEALPARLLDSGNHEPGFDRPVSGTAPTDVPFAGELRFFTLGGELFGAPSSGLGSEAVKPGPITPMPGTHSHVRGVTFSNRRLLPVIDLVQRVSSHCAEPDCQMLVAEIGDAAFGFLVDSDCGTARSEGAVIEPAPLIAQTSWMKRVIVSSGELIPLVDLGLTLSPDSAKNEEPVWNGYVPDSTFPELFFKQEIEIAEFSLLGERYALPKAEVEGVVPFRPWRVVPDVPAIVAGVAEHDGEILPVVDLAALFGRRSRPTPAWRMVVVKNGNFRALIVTEATYEAKRLAPEMHRFVPLNLPHDLMYGCYPDGKAARIILNVLAIAVHFEESLIGQFQPTLAHGAVVPPEGMAYADPDGDAVRVAQTTEPTGASNDRAENPAGEAYSATGEIKALESDVGKRPSGDAGETPQQSVSSHAPAGGAAAEPHAGGKPPGMTMAVPEQIRHSEDPDRPPKGYVMDMPAFRHAEAAHQILPHAGAMSSAKPGNRPEGNGTSALDGGEVLRPEPPIEESASFSSQWEGTAHEENPSRPWKSRIALGAIVAVPLALLFYFAGSHITSDKNSLGKTAGTEPEKVARAMDPTSQTPATKPFDAMKIQAQPPRATADSPATLELVIPKHMTGIDMDEYVVVQGDTLWSISLRFTGSPFNYPRIAGENRIADPDLIFPGQRIKFIK